MILSCKCKHDYQDKQYGKGKRVMNSCAKDPTGKTYRCTVCSTEKVKGEK